MKWDVAFPMYVLPEVCDGMTELWEQMRWRLRDAGFQDLPETPQFDNPLDDGEMDEQLWLLHLCSFPYLKNWQESKVISPLVSFHYDFAYCEGMLHSSVLLVQKNSDIQTLEEARGKKAAMNERISNSGMNLFRREVAEIANSQPFFSEVMETGGHMDSLEAVVTGKADICALDCVTYGYAGLYCPNVNAHVRVIGRTHSCPSLPLFVPSDMPEKCREQIYRTLRDVIADPRNEKLLREKLHIKGISRVNDAELEVSRRYEEEAIALGYPELV